MFLIFSCGNDDDGNNINPNQLSKPVLLTPANNSTIERLPDYTYCCHDFEWTEVLNATQYLAEYSSDINFTNILESSTTTETYDTPDFYVPPAGDYYWRVRAFAPGFEPSNYSDVFKVTLVD